jgi:hypothetical protein
LDVDHVRARKYILIAILSVLVAFLLGRALLSLRWRMIHDSPLMLYAAFLMDRHDAVPYKDFFDMNMPGTYFLNLLLAKTLGYSDLAFRLYDLLYLTLLSLVTFHWVKRINRLAAYFSAVVFPLTYLTHGAIMSMQREYLALLPFVCGLAVVVSDHRSPRRVLRRISRTTCSALRLSPDLIAASFRDRAAPRSAA